MRGVNDVHPRFVRIPLPALSVAGGDLFMDQPPEPRYLTEPYLTTQLDLARVEQTLRHLADATRSPLPRRLRHRLLRIARMLARIQQELHDAPGRIEAERWRED